MDRKFALAGMLLIGLATASPALAVDKAQRC